MTVGLQHDSNATVWDAEVALSATAHVLEEFAMSIVKVKHRAPERCPRCESYRFVSDGDITERDGEEGWLTAQVCSACGYRSPETFETWQDRDVRIAREALDEHAADTSG